MAIKRPQSECVEHTIEINKIKNDMERVKDHELKFNRTIDRVESSITLLNDSVIKINLALEHFKDMPDKVRKLEDKSIFLQVFEKFAWIAVGALTVAFINQNFIATREKQEYKIQNEQPYKNR